MLPYKRCSGATADPYEDTGLDPMTELVLEHMLFKYATENLVIVNIYIKVSTVFVHLPVLASNIFEKSVNQYKTFYENYQISLN